jgi:hypothetical protein
MAKVKRTVKDKPVKKPKSAKKKRNEGERGSNTEEMRKVCTFEPDESN